MITKSEETYYNDEPRNVMIIRKMSFRIRTKSYHNDKSYYDKYLVINKLKK